MYPHKDPKQALYAINDSLIGWGLNHPGERRKLEYSEEENTPVLVLFKPSRETDTTRLLIYPMEIFDPALYVALGMIAISADKEYTPDLGVHRRMVNTAIREMINLLRASQSANSAETQQLP